MTFRTHHYAVVFQVAWVVKLFHIVLTEGQTCNSNILPLRSYRRNFYFLVTMILHFTLKFFELLKCFRFMFHQVDIPISAQIICEGQKIMIPVASLNTHRTAYISMYYFQQVCCSLHYSGERSLSHLDHEAWFTSIRWCPSAWSFFMHFIPIWPKRQCHKYIALWLSTLHILASILWICVSLKSRFNKPSTLGVWPYIEGFIHVNRITIYSLS